MRALLFCLLIPLAHAGDVVRLRYERMEGTVTVTGHGTAFAIGEHSLLSAAHNVLDDNGNPYKTLHMEVNGDWIKCEVVKVAKDIDLCLLKTAASLDPFKLANADASRGDVLTLAGSKRGKPITKHSGIVERLFDSGRALSRMRVEFYHGDSGGPVLSEGKVVGVAVAGEPLNGDIDPKVCLFVPLAAIRDFLK